MKDHIFKGHYGTSNTFSSVTHTIGANGFGDGRLDGNGAYSKTNVGPDAAKGAVYISAGSSGKISSAALDHNAMYYSVASLGSCIIETNGNMMDVKFIRETGAIDDYFTVTKTTNNCITGDPCDDGDICTINDIYDSNCGCTGTFQDSDNDSVCDANDQCPGFDDGIIGTSCNDLDTCTINDVYDANCDCAGVYTDEDNDGFCVGSDPDDSNGCVPDSGSLACDPCTDRTNDGFESGFGNWNDGGNDCARVASNANTGAYSIRIRDNTGVSSSMTTDNIDLAGETEVSVEFSFYPVGMETNEDFFLEISTNGGSSYSIYQEWNSGIEFQNNVRENESIDLTGITWTSQSRFRFRCDASGNNDQIYIDDIVIKTCVISCQTGAICDDGNACTDGETYNASCDCTGGVSTDSDNDGVCDGNDICPGGDDNVDGDADGIPDFCDLTNGNCTLNDPCTDVGNCIIIGTYDSNCICIGTVEDSDGDGVCDGDDVCPGIDDNSPACNPCMTINSESFETNFGIWNDGGSDCARVRSNAKTGIRSIRIRDNSGSRSSMFSDNIDLSTATDVDIEFSFLPVSMEVNEDFFLEISTNGGSSYSIYKEWNSGVEFQNNQRVDEIVSITNYGFTATTRFRFRCDASSNNDQIYIDDVIITSCTSSNFDETITRELSFDNNDKSLTFDFQFFPVPASDRLMVDLSLLNNQKATLTIYNLKGERVFIKNILENHGTLLELPINELVSGIYAIGIETEFNEFKVKKLVIAK